MGNSLNCASGKSRGMDRHKHKGMIDNKGRSCSLQSGDLVGYFPLLISRVFKRLKITLTVSEVCANCSIACLSPLSLTRGDRMNLFLEGNL